MLDPQLEPHWLPKILDWMWAGVLGLVGVLYTKNEKRFETIDSKIDHEVRCARIEIKGKADEAEMIRQRQNISDLFKGQERIRDEMSQGFVQMNNKMSDTHIVLLNKLNEIGKQ